MDDIKRTILNLGKNVSKTSSGLLKTTKLSISLTNEQENLKSLYLDIGRKVHEIYMYGGSLGKFFDEKYKEIMEVEKNIQYIQEQISKIKGTKECLKCGKEAEATAEFCPKCGAAMNHSVDILPEPEYKPLPPEPEQARNNTKACPTCGADNESNSKFCLSCGRIL